MLIYVSYKELNMLDKCYKNVTKGTYLEVAQEKIDRYKEFVREICGDDKETLSNVLRHGFNTKFSLLKTEKVLSLVPP